MTHNLQILGVVNFPKPSGQNVNMMPFIMGEKETLPNELHSYWPILEACSLEKEQLGMVGYLTVQETAVTPGFSQRRPGVHVEKHPSGGWGGTPWGHGRWQQAKSGGLYMASNMDGTTAVWDRQVETPGPGGDVEFLRETLGEPMLLNAGELLWLTDSCPHESPPTTEPKIRQFFRLVTHEVSLWYKDHSTPSPLGVSLPPYVTVISGNKFDS